MAVFPEVYSVSATQTEDDWGTMKFRDVTVSWSGTPGAEYEVERRHSTSSTWEWVGSGWDGSTSITETFFEGSDTFGWYEYRVTPTIWDVDAGYVEGSPGFVSVNVTKVAYPPSLPRSVRAAATNGAVKVTWTAPTTADYYCEGTSYYFCDSATSYIVSWAPSGGAWQSVTTTSTSRTISGLRNGTTYYFAVSAANAVGRSASTTSVNAVPRTVPSVPRSVTATPSGYNQMVLRWAAPASTGGSPVTGYTISYAPSGGTWTSFNVSAATRSRTITALRGGTAYYFRVSAYNVAGRSVPTASVRAVSIANRKPKAASIYSVTNGNKAVTLRWSQPTDTGGLPITRYYVQMRSGASGVWGAWQNLGPVVGSRTYTARGLVNGRAYQFRVIAANRLGWGPWSPSVRARPIAPPPPVTFGAGTYRVGIDIPAGLYRAPGGYGCYWERLSGFSGSFDDIIDNDFTTGGTVYVQILSTDRGFYTDSDCGRWTKIG